MTDFADLRRQILAHYPIGSEWYDCGQDNGGKVILHIESRGILLRSWGDPSSLLAFGYHALLALPARLITPRDGGYYFQWREEREAEAERYMALLKEHGLDAESIWS